MSEPIRVLIVDDHAVVRSGIRLLLDQEPDIEPVGEAGSGREAVFQARSLKPDVILMDVVMPDQTGLEVLPTLLRERRLSIPFGELTGASIARGHAERLRGLPVLMLQLRGGAALRIASLEGAGALHELARKVERGGLPIAV